MVDLLAAVPSVVYGLWGIVVLAPRSVAGLRLARRTTSAVLPFFDGPASATGRTILTAGIVLAIMILPIITAITREVFLQTPRCTGGRARPRRDPLGDDPDGGLPLRTLRHRIGASMLGLGRALGETMAVAMVLSATGVVTFNLISQRQPSTIAANIALKFPEAIGPATSTP